MSLKDYHGSLSTGKIFSQWPARSYINANIVLLQMLQISTDEIRQVGITNHLPNSFRFAECFPQDQLAAFITIQKTNCLSQEQACQMS